MEEQATLWTDAARRAGLALVDADAYSLSADVPLDASEIDVCVAAGSRWVRPTR